MNKHSAVFVSEYADADEARRAIASSGIATVSVDQSAFDAARSSLPQPNIPLIPAVGVDANDSFKESAEKMIAAAIFILIPQLNALPLSIIRLFIGWIRGKKPARITQSSVEETAIKAWSLALPGDAARALTSVQSAKTSLAAFKPDADANERKKYLTSAIAGLTNAIQYTSAAGGDSFKAWMEHRAPAYVFTPSVKSLPAMWEAGFYIAPWYDPELGSDQATLEIDDNGHPQIGHVDNLSRADAAVLAVLSGYKKGATPALAIVKSWGKANVSFRGVQSLQAILVYQTGNVNLREVVILTAAANAGDPALAKELSDIADDLMDYLASAVFASQDVPNQLAQIYRSAASESSAVDLAQFNKLAAHLQKESGGVEEGFLPLLAAAAPIAMKFAAPMLGSLLKMSPAMKMLGSMGGGSKPSGQQQAAPSQGFALPGLLGTLMSLLGGGGAGTAGGLPEGGGLAYGRPEWAKGELDLSLGGIDEAGGRRRRRRRKKRRAQEQPESDPDAPDKVKEAQEELEDRLTALEDQMEERRSRLKQRAAPRPRPRFEEEDGDDMESEDLITY
jgi:hypothetical protein